MAERIPLNLYKRVTKNLKRGVPEQIYKTPLDRASTIISAIGSNITNGSYLLSLSLSSADTNETFLTIPNITLEPLEYNNLLPSKLVIGENDEIVGIVDIEDKVTINDPDVFWLYDIPSTLTEVSLLINFDTISTNIIIDWGINNIPNTSSGQSTLSSETPVTYVYDLLDESNTIITLSILESNNTQ
jgi:hypothetical protein